MSVTGPKRAFVLAAGYGTRMLPLTRDLPKPLMPLWGKPLLQHALEMLARWGVRDVLINLHHKPGDILEFLRGHSGFGLRIALSFEPEILGTGGALQKAGWFVDEQPFWLINSDVTANLNPAPLVRAFQRGNPIAALWLHPSRGPRTVEMRNGRITNFASSKPGAPGTYTFCGLHLLSPRILRHIPESGFAGIIDAYVRAMRRGEKVLGVCIKNSYWADLGTPAQYLDAHAETRAAVGSKRDKTFVAVGANCAIARDAVVTDSVLWDGTQVASGACVHRSVIGRGTRVEGRVEGVACRGDIGLERAEAAAITAAGMKPEDTTIYPLSARGSARTFTRVQVGARTVMLIRYSVEREENALYCGHARFLARAGIRVPKVLADCPAERVAVMEDLGSRSLTAAIKGAAPARVFDLYRKVLDEVVRLHEKGTALARKSRVRLMPPFDERLYRWERDFFADQLLRRRMGIRPALIRAAAAELARVAGRLLLEPRVLIHRDLQSSNIYLTEKGPALIDFQGMRMGPAAYDLASLLCDPYVALPVELQARLLAYYNRKARVPVPEEVFRLAVVERLAQAMGAYVRLGRIPGMRPFERYITQAANSQLLAATEIEGMAAIKQLARELSRKKFDRD